MYNQSDPTARRADPDRQPDDPTFDAATADTGAAPAQRVAVADAPADDREADDFAEAEQAREERTEAEQVGEEQAEAERLEQPDHLEQPEHEQKQQLEDRADRDEERADGSVAVGVAAVPFEPVGPMAGPSAVTPVTTAPAETSTYGTRTDEPPTAEVAPEAPADKTPPEEAPPEETPPEETPSDETASDEEAPPAEELMPGDVAAEPLAAFWNDADVEGIRGRWRELQLRFIDGPREVAVEAAQLVEEAVASFTASLNARKDELSDWQADESDDTERLRVTVRRYRDFLDRVLGL